MDLSDLRRLLLRNLYLRREAALRTSFLTLRIRQESAEPVTDAAVAVELQFLAGKSLVTSTPDELGSATHHTLTAEGVLYCERNNLNA